MEKKEEAETASGSNIPYGMHSMSSLYNPYMMGMGGDIFDNTRAPSHRNSFDAMADFNSYRMQTMQQPVLMQQQDPNRASGISAEACQMMLEKEAKWSEVRRYSELIRRFATDAMGIEITKENYYDLYNMAVCLLRSVDNLDPDKAAGVGGIMAQRKQSDVALPGAGALFGSHPVTSAAAAMALQQADLEFLQARKSFDLYYTGRNSMDGTFMPLGAPSFLNNMNPTPSMPFLNTPAAPAPIPAPQQVVKAEPLVKSPIANGSPLARSTDGMAEGEEGDDNKTKRRRRRTVYASRRNLHCYMCGATETPEWRRGPAGDHTLCNACGLHYAKSQKKKKKEQEGRKHSIDMLLNVKNVKE